MWKGASLVAQWQRLPAKAGDMGAIQHAAEQLSPCTTTIEPVL